MNRNTYRVEIDISIQILYRGDWQSIQRLRQFSSNQFFLHHQNFLLQVTIRLHVCDLFSQIPPVQKQICKRKIRTVNKRKNVMHFFVKALFRREFYFASLLLNCQPHSFNTLASTAAACATGKYSTNFGLYYVNFRKKCEVTFIIAILLIKQTLTRRKDNCAAISRSKWTQCAHTY